MAGTVGWLHSKAPVRSAMVVGDVLADYAFGMATGHGRSPDRSSRVEWFRSPAQRMNSPGAIGGASQCVLMNRFQVRFFWRSGAGPIPASSKMFATVVRAFSTFSPVRKASRIFV